MLRGQREGDHIADVVRHDLGAINVQRVEQARHVLGLDALLVAARPDGGEAHAAQVGHDDRVVAGQIFGQRAPHVAGLAIAVQQQHGRAGAAGADMQRDAVGRDLPRLEAGGEGMHLRQGRRGEKRQAAEGGQHSAEHGVDSGLASPSGGVL
jgi:hypothetical protein